MHGGRREPKPATFTYTYSYRNAISKYNHCPFYKTGRFPLHKELASIKFNLPEIAKTCSLHNKVRSTGFSIMGFTFISSNLASIRACWLY